MKQLNRSDSRRPTRQLGSALRASLFLAAASIALPALAAETVGTATPLAVIADFRQQPARELQPYADWRWSPEEKAKAGSFSRRAIAPNPDGNGSVLRLEITPEFPWGGSPERLLQLTNGHFPPESDAVVLRLRVESGVFTVAIGGPTAYYGDSDVITSPQRIEAGDWREVHCDLHEGLCRNYRRAGFGRAAQSIAYNRWAQEPPQFYILPGSTGVLLLETASLVATGRGRPFRVFNPASMAAVQSAPTTLANAFTLLVADSQTADFERSWRDVPACRYPPPQLAEVPGPAGAAALSATAEWAEEIRWAGVRTKPAAGANALVLTVRATSPVVAMQFTSDAGQPVDIGLLCGTAAAPFPWERLGPPEEWRQGATASGFDVSLSNRETAKQSDLHVAQYQTRRFVKAGEWQTLTLPFEDFVCIAGTGTLQADLVSRASPAAEAVAGVTWMLPWPRGGRAVGAAIQVADVQFVTIAVDDPAPRRSYPAPVPATLEPLPGVIDYGGWHRSCRAAAALGPDSAQPPSAD